MYYYIRMLLKKSFTRLPTSITESLFNLKQLGNSRLNNYRNIFTIPSFPSGCNSCNLECVFLLANFLNYLIEVEYFIFSSEYYL